MNDVNIKEYLSLNVENKKNSRNYKGFAYEKILDNGSDLIFRRTSIATGQQKDLSIIPSENLIFIRDVKTGKDKVVEKSATIKTFFSDLDQSGFKEMMEDLKNPFFKKNFTDSFAECVLGITQDRLWNEFVKRGYDPNEFFPSSLNSSGKDFLYKYLEQKPQTFFKIITYLKDSGITFSSSLTTHLIHIAFERNPNDAMWMIDVLKKSQNKFELRVFYYWSAKEVTGILDIIEKHNLDFRRYIQYLFQDLFTQGISVIDSSLISDYDDCLTMQEALYDGKARDKYPKHLKECHDKVTLAYNLNQEYFEHQKAVKLFNACKKMEYSDGEYSIITPEDSSELITEGINLHHCVGSYVDKVNSGKTSILFLRKTNEINESLITIEYCDGAITQVRGLCERLMDENERNFFNKWTKNFKIPCVGE